MENKRFISNLRYIEKKKKIPKKQIIKNLVEKEYVKMIKAQKIKKGMAEIKDYKEISFYLETDGDILHYIHFLKDLYKITKEIYISEIDIFNKNILIKEEIEKVNIVFITYYPFKFKKIENIPIEDTDKIEHEILKVGKQIQIIRETQNLPLTNIIKHAILFHKTDGDLMEEILSW